MSIMSKIEHVSSSASEENFANKSTNYFVEIEIELVTAVTYVKLLQINTLLMKLVKIYTA